MVYPEAIVAWTELRREAARLRLRPGSFGWLRKEDVPDPVAGGARISVGWPAGQESDYRFPSEADCGGVHVQGVGAYWRVHVDPNACRPLAHLRFDAPREAWPTVATVIGALIGCLLARRRGDWAIGAAAGLAIGIASQRRAMESSR